MEEIREEIKPIGWIEDQVIKAPKFFWWSKIHQRLPKRIRSWFVKKYGTPNEIGISENLIVNVGKALMSARLGGLSGAALTYVATGTGATAPAAADTTLEGEVYRVASSNTQVTTTTTNDTLQAAISIPITGSATIKKVGTFNAAAAGTLVNAALLGTPRAVISGDTHNVTVKIKFS